MRSGARHPLDPPAVQGAAAAVGLRHNGRLQRGLLAGGADERNCPAATSATDRASGVGGAASTAAANVSPPPLWALEEETGHVCLEQRRPRIFRAGPPQASATTGPISLGGAQIHRIHNWCPQRRHQSDPHGRTAGGRAGAHSEATERARVCRSDSFLSLPRAPTSSLGRTHPRVWGRAPPTGRRARGVCGWRVGSGHAGTPVPSNCGRARAPPRWAWVGGRTATAVQSGAPAALPLQGCRRCPHVGARWPTPNPWGPQPVAGARHSLPRGGGVQAVVDGRAGGAQPRPVGHRLLFEGKAAADRLWL